MALRYFVQCLAQSQQWINVSFSNIVKMAYRNVSSTYTPASYVSEDSLLTFLSMSIFTIFKALLLQQLEIMSCFDIFNDH